MLAAEENKEKEKSCMSECRSGGHNYHICLGAFKFRRARLVEMDLLRESLQVEKYPRARGAEEVLRGNRREGEVEVCLPDV